MTDASFGLPRDLGDGLCLRWATVDDAEAVAEFNVSIHSDEPDQPDKWLRHWTHDLMRGDHPTTSASDFTVVVDGKADGRIASTLCIIPQTWAYEGIAFAVGRPELVGTLVEYRRKGLVRAQMEAIHAKSGARGELVTAITGIPWYYRQFGYEMGLNLGGSRQLFWARPGNEDETTEAERYCVRPASPDDIPLLQRLYQQHLGQSPICRLRDETQWRYEMTGSHPNSIWSLKAHIIETVDGKAVAYANFEPWGSTIAVSELGVSPGHSWRAVGRFLTRYLHRQANELNPARPQGKQITHISFGFGEAHPLYEAMGPELEKQIRPYAWYVRVPDLPAFLRHITPALEARLDRSVLAGHTGRSKINLYRTRFEMIWENGCLKEVTDGYEYNRIEQGDAAFPELTFLQLLFGYRSLDELDQSHADAYARDHDTAVLLNILFPKRPSHVIPMG